MSENAINMYDRDPHLAEIYDQTDAYTDDVALIRRVVGQREPLRILEPFCGTGRLLIPLAMDGHTLVGLDQAQGMLARAQVKIRRLPAAVQGRITIVQADVTRDEWPRWFDLVILGGNCFYELATPAEQAQCLRWAAVVLNAGGHVYVDNNHMEGELDPAWQQAGVRQGFPTGICTDGTVVESTTETIWWDGPRRLVRFRRCTTVTRPDGTRIRQEYVQQKHPVSAVEVEQWLETYGFRVEGVYGDRAGQPYTATSSRAIFWATKR